MAIEKTSMDRKIIIGLIFIGIGVLYFLNLFDFFTFNISYYIFSWKTILIIIGLVVVANPNNRVTGLVLIGAGILFWLPEFFNFRIHFRQIFFPALLIFIGILLIAKRKSPVDQNSRRDFKKYGDQKSNEQPKNDNQPENEFTDYEEVNESQKKKEKTEFERDEYQSYNDANMFSGNFIDETVVFSGKTIKLFSDRFLGGKLTAIFGGININMHHVKLASGGIILDNTAIFGGITLIVPDDWTVKSEVTSIFGGYDDSRVIKGGTSPNHDKILIIKGFAFFGGIDLKSF
ncbi:MAG: cell wall-active antibiotics response protein [Lentimicrobiaceae bacterium]|jgi:predicted membrane protein|nr:cell wall-active antibiotics response protein [Lentimicrobiaceae bacterium]